jgi:hypothetical protein
VDFTALGVFYNYDLNEYSVRDISKDVTWFARQPPEMHWKSEYENRIFFRQKGEAEVLARYAGEEGSLRRVEVRDKVYFELKKIKHLLALPEMAIALTGDDIKIRVFASYDDNSVAELTNYVQWRVSDPGILVSNKAGYFLGKKEGIVQVVAMKDGLESLPVKLVLVNNRVYLDHFITGEINSHSKNRSKPNVIKDIQKNVDKLKKDFSVKKKELREIRVAPELLEISLGDAGMLTATGIYNDGSSSDLTILGDWNVLNRSIATVSSGNISSVSEGETSAYVEFKGVRSKYARIIVGGPKLVSLLLTPPGSRIARDAKVKLNVQGNYYDHSQRDLTDKVSWGQEGEQIAKIENGTLYPLKFGQARIYAEYANLKSNFSEVEVIFTWGWLFWLSAKIVFVLLLGIFCVVFVLYTLAQNKRMRLRSLTYDPRKFILELYKNATRLITIFGLRYDDYTFPLFYAERAKQKFLIKDNHFWNLSVKFEEAKYSQHVLERADVVEALDNYNKFFQKLCKDQSRRLSFYRHCLALLHCRPIFILSAAEASGLK